MPTYGPQQRLSGQAAVDFEGRVDMARLKRERLARLQAQMAKADLGGILFFDPVNIRYASGYRYCGMYPARFFAQYAVVPQQGEPRVSSYRNEDGNTALEKGTLWDFFACGRNIEEAARLWGKRIAGMMRELGISGQKLGIDKLDFYSSESLRAQRITIADGRVPLERARAIKTQDEVALIRQACTVAEIAISRVREAIKPGVTENKLYSIMAATNIEFGGEHIDDRLLTAGSHSNPWGGQSDDHIVRPGDLVGMDTDMAGPMGYFADFSRTYLCGDGKPNKEQLEAYKIAYNFIYDSMQFFKPGMSFPEIAASCPTLPEEYRYQRYPMIAHGDGMSDEWPTIHWPDRTWSGFGNDPDVLEENMVMSIEGLASKRGARESVKLEEEVLITVNGPELLSHAPFDDRFF